MDSPRSRAEAAIAAVGGALEPIHRSRLLQIIALAPCTVEAVHAELWPGGTPDAQNQALRRLLAKPRGRVQMTIDGARRLGPLRTVRVWVAPSADEMGCVSHG